MWGIRPAARANRENRMKVTDMAEKKQFEAEEREHLAFVENYIKEKLSETGTDLSSLRDYIYEQRRRTWEDFARASEHPEQNLQELTQMAMTEQRDVGRYERLEKMQETLVRLADNPYFARLDIEEDGDTDRIYVGRRSLIDEESSDILVCDWRSDIASVFYDSGLGKTSYNCPAGRVECNLKLKRQFVIRDGALQYMFDSDIAVEDDVLMHELGKDSDLKMKTVVSTIQCEQNEIIRNTSSDVCLVQGVAGSGKTSIALHRLAYLLYRYRDSLTAGNIIIFSPNRVFDTYIADVLPELGEDRVTQTSFHDLFSPFFEKTSFGDFVSQAEDLFAERISPEEIVAKGGKALTDLLSERTRGLADEQISISDVMFYDEPVCGAEELKKIYFELYAKFAHDVRKEKILAGIGERLDTEFRNRRRSQYAFELTQDGIIDYSDEALEEAMGQRWAEDRQKVLDSVCEMLDVSAEKIYLRCLEDLYPEYAAGVAEGIESGKLKYCDMFACAFVKALLGQIKIDVHIKHAVIDEAQDYPYVLYKTLSVIYPKCRFTVLGDLAQGAVRHYGSIGELSEVFAPRSVCFRELNKSYRSTVEINEFASRFCDNNSDYTFFERHGDPVTEIDRSDIGKILDENEKYRSKAVICRTLAECKSVYDELRAQGRKLTLIGKEDVLYPERTAVVPSYLAKGLEFDLVVIADPLDSWKSDAEKKALFVSASRALHKLYVLRPEKGKKRKK